MITNFNRVLFDYDGTILIHNKETEPKDIAQILNLSDEKEIIFERELVKFWTNYSNAFKGHRITYDLYFQVVENMIPSLKSFKITPQEFIEAVEYKNSKKSHIAEGLVDTLEYLIDKGYKLCVCTNGFYNLQVQSMKNHDVFKYFEEVYAWDGNYPKPDLRFMKKALSGTNPKSNVMIGDNLVSDIQMAKRAGVFSILYKTRTSENIKPDICIENMCELKNIL